jgi:putative transposase
MVNINTDIWRWYHNVSECYYHIQITIKYRKSLLNKKFEGVILESIRGVKERYAIEVSHVGFDQNHIHLLMTFLPKYSGGQVIRLLKSITSKAIFREIPEVKTELWGGEFWTDGYFSITALLPFPLILEM